jgi:apolipoprotein N-acyltransferase
MAGQEAMTRPQVSDPPGAGTHAPKPAARFVVRWYGRICLLLLGAGLLTLAFAPVNQFYLAWLGLVPWLFVLSTTRSQWSAFFWSWLAGTFFFIANMWWMAYVTAPGMVALMAILGLYWGYAGLIIRGAGLLKNREDGRWKIEDGQRVPRHSPSSILNSPLLRILLIAAVWVAAGEWFRGTWPWHGLPWLHLGHTQSSVLWVCQIADIVGVAGISFIIAMVNAWIAMWLIERPTGTRRLIPSGVTIFAIVAIVIGYGVWRFHTEQLTPGPTVVVVQPNIPQSATGEKGATREDLLEFHERETERTILARPRGSVDLVAWSETMLPSLNAEARAFFRTNPQGALDTESLNHVVNRVGNMAFALHTNVLTGGQFFDKIKFTSDGLPLAADSRNSSYLFDRAGALTEYRYDKIHLVPFGEFVPFKQGFPPLYRLLVAFGPPDMDYYQLQPGDEQHLTVFPLKTGGGDDGRPERDYRLVSPICFEDIDAGICAKMFRPEPADPDHKRADFLVNLTNDGWFKANENAQHLQAAIFRSIENRVPSARSVNTGISGFIDPLGRKSGLVEARTEGSSLGTLLLDSRVTVFTRWGEWFAQLCAGVTVIVALAALGGWIARRRRRDV